MDELLLNGVYQNEESFPTENPLQTERFIAKFKGSKPIGTKKPNFLNRKRPLKQTINSTFDEIEASKTSLNFNSLALTSGLNSPGQKSPRPQDLKESAYSGGIVAVG